MADSHADNPTAPAQLVTQSPQETLLFGKALGAAIGNGPGLVIALHGTLGAGKTKLTQGIAAGLGIDPAGVVSPTFTIAVPYEGSRALLHLDAYRIQADEEVDELGLDELIDQGVVVVVEWASRIVELLPPVDLEIKLSQIANARDTPDDQQASRTIQLTGVSAAGHKLLAGVKNSYFH